MIKVMAEAEIIDLDGKKRMCPLLKAECIEKRCGFYNRNQWCCGIGLIGE